MLCLRCDHQGSIYKAKIDAIGEIVYICDECDGTWPNPRDILLYPKNFSYSLGEFLEECGLDYIGASVTELGYDWDKSVLQDDTLIFCPLCGPHGLIYEIKLKNFDTPVYSCEDQTCDATWLPEMPITHEKYFKLANLFKTYGLEYSSERFDGFQLLHNQEKSGQPNDA